MASRSTPPPADAPLGIHLRYLRYRRNYTGAKLGKVLGWSQPKVSKIETGTVIPSRSDLERLIRTLSPTADEANHLRKLAEQSREQFTDWRAGRQDPAGWQRDIARLEAEATELRIFQPALLSGLLQTSETVRAILNDILQMSAENGIEGSVAETVSARLQRQEILEDRRKRFFFIIPEAVLHGLLSQGADIPAQLKRIRYVADQDNVDLRIMADETKWPIPPTNGFELLDDRYAVIDLFNTNVVARGPTDLHLYRRIFDAISEVATTDIDPMLEKYRRLYLERETAANR
jgi:transcriptional regulator with XRE-family HTH domain